MTVPGTKLSQAHKERISRSLKKFHAVPEQSQDWYEKFAHTRETNIELGLAFTRRKHLGDDMAAPPPSRVRTSHRGEPPNKVVSMLNNNTTPPATDPDTPSDDWQEAEVVEVRYRCPQGDVTFEVNRSGELFVSVGEGIDAASALELTHRASAFVARHNLLRKVRGGRNQPSN